MEHNQIPISNPNEPNPAIQQIGLLNLRMKDFIQELNNTLTVLVSYNAALQKENAELKAKQVKA